jgi:hypothetical protein
MSIRQSKVLIYVLCNLIYVLCGTLEEKKKSSESDIFVTQLAAYLATEAADFR